MKKLEKIIILIITLCPLILSAKTSEEVKYKFYTEVEDKVHYEKDVEHSCEYFEIVDKNTFVYSDPVSTSFKPDEKEGRVIEEGIKEISLSRDYITKLEINYFYAMRINKKIYEIEFFDSNGTKLNYEIEDATFSSGWFENINDNDLYSYVLVDSKSKVKVLFNDAVDIKNMKIKITYENDANTLYGIVYMGYVNDIYTDAYDYNSVNKTITCEEDKCFMEMDLKDKTPTERDLKIKTKVYTYKDPMYKCYSLKKIYVPGYYKEMEDFLKDEEKYIIEIVEDNIEEKDALKSEITSLSKSNETVLNELKSINNDNILSKIDDAVGVLKNQKDDEIINKINSLSKSVSNKKEIDYSDTFNELKELNTINTQKLNNLEKILSSLDNSKAKIIKEEKSKFNYITLIIISVFELITVVLLILISKKIVNKSHMK